MCGRYQFTVTQCAEILRIVRDVQEKYGEGTWKPGEILPSSTAPVLVRRQGTIIPELFTWGFRLPNTLVINARAETALEKPLFRDSVANGRCVVPSTGFFEWDSGKRKYLFTLPGCDVLYMAGLCAVRDGQSCYCILTTNANESMREVHNRMPLVLTREQVPFWLERLEAVPDILQSQPPPPGKDCNGHTNRPLVKDRAPNSTKRQPRFQCNAEIGAGCLWIIRQTGRSITYFARTASL